MKPVGAITRGTTNPNRLRRVDNFIAFRCADRLLAAAAPLVMDLGYGATPVTAVELRGRLAATVRPDVTVVGVEIDPVRVAAALPYADPPRLEFRRGGFELAGLAPAVVRAFNVLRQYPEDEVAAAWRQMTSTGATLIEGTCDELGRIATWAVVEDGVPVTLTLSARLPVLAHPAVFAERLPKALIHHNVPGHPVHELLRALGRAWETEATPFGPRQRWLATVRRMRAEGWPVLDGPARWRLGELSLPWPS
ncbi:class I SAM-dependent methyltransferase [Actinoplanes oblitus]|uniref:Class I SAM-dependent methyltransferase n=1 Tax=Actinoplanes oblitus TaxID=3040509 RepID=A0ABY8WDZ4_9ACTN|nr:class I SAM-dependent methyltransferase [Actinoplanes oblitus]WIM96066.1 class I SAM-dependent methyltransferase [Actinoplanes oblitus]